MSFNLLSVILDLDILVKKKVIETIRDTGNLLNKFYRFFGALHIDFF